VSPAKTGAVNFTSSQLRLATAFWLTSDTDRPVTMAKVSVETTSGRPNSVREA
jgi:hypothetical protein